MSEAVRAAAVEAVRRWGPAWVLVILFGAAFIGAYTGRLTSPLQIAVNELRAEVSGDAPTSLKNLLAKHVEDVVAIREERRALFQIMLVLCYNGATTDVERRRCDNVALAVNRDQPEVP